MTIVKSLLDPKKAAYDHMVPACTPWSGLVRKGQCLRIIDVAGQQAVDTLFYRDTRGDARIREHGGDVMTIVKSLLDPNKAAYDHMVPACTPWSGLVRKGQCLRIIDVAGQQAVDTLFYRADKFAERYDAQGTLAGQGSAYVAAGTQLLSNEGNVMATMIADTCGDHDTSAGACSCEANTVRFGHHTRYMHACRENFLIELAKYGMDKRDIVSNINFFMNVPILPDGELAIVDGVSKPNDYIELRAEMDVLCVISNCPQVNNPCNGFDPTPIRVLIWDAPGN